MSGSSAAPTERFSDRVADYVAARPGYPDDLIDRLRALGAVPKGSLVADVGCGTGISAELLLRHGCEVVGIEPNAAMRAAAETRLGSAGRFRGLAGTAEATTLPSASVDAVLAAQAFHWFEPAQAHREFERILRPSARRDGPEPGRAPAILLWNDRRIDGTPLLVEYEELLQRFGTDYNQVSHRRIDDAAVRRFFGTAPVQAFAMRNQQRLDREGLRARLRSSSYVPAAGAPRHEAMLAELDAIFDRWSIDGTVAIEYDLRAWVGWILPLRPPDAQSAGAAVDDEHRSTG